MMASEHMPEFDRLIREFAEDVQRQADALERMVELLRPVLERLGVEEADDGE